MATANPPGSPLASSTPPSVPTYRGPFAVMTVLFFLWGFLAVLNDILIPRFKEAFSLNFHDAMLVQRYYFGGYFTGALIYYIVSVIYGDPINRIGYKNGVVIGLLIAAFGSLLFYPAAVAVSYPFFLTALFILALGLSILQIAANPYVTIMGPEPTASSRLNLAQGFNSFGTTIGPIIGGWLIFTFFATKNAHGADSVKYPYLGLAAVLALMAVFFMFARLPAFTNTGKIQPGLGALKHPHTALGMLTIFMYVGGEVTVGSAIISYLALPKLGGLDHDTASKFLAFYWGGLMIGRFMGAFALSAMRKSLKHLLVTLTPVVAFLAIWLVPILTVIWNALPAPADATLLHNASLAGLHNATHYGAPLALLLVAFYLGEASAHRMLALFSAIIIGLLLTSMATGGQIAMWSILAVGLFCSVMWSNIFSLAIESLGPQKSQASSLLIMAVIGGGILPPLQGAIADHYGIQASFIVPVIAFAYVAFYGLYGYKAGRPAKP